MLIPENIQAALKQALANYNGEGSNEALVWLEFETLTLNEIEIVKLMAQGYETDEIAKMRSVAIKTVQLHIGRAMSKLYLTNRVQLTLWAIKRGLVTVEVDATPMTVQIPMED